MGDLIVRRGVRTARRIDQGRDVGTEDRTVRPPDHRVLALDGPVLVSLHATTIRSRHP